MRLSLAVPHFGSMGGVGQYALGLVPSLAREHEVEILTFDGSYKPTENSKTRVHVERSFGYGTFPQLVMSNTLASAKLEAMRRTTRSSVTHSLDGHIKADVVTAQGTTAEWQGLSAAHSVLFWMPSNLSRATYAILSLPFALSHLEGMVAKRGCKILITPSNRMKTEFIAHHGVEPNKIRVISYGVDTRRFRPEPQLGAEGRMKLGVKEDETLVLLVGWDIFRKGLIPLVRALEGIKGCKLLVLGRKSLPSFVVSLAKSNGVEIRSIVTDRPEIYYWASDLFVLPSLYEPFGQAVLEAMASGLPVIVSECVGAAELITDNIDGVKITNPLSTVELANKIKSTLEDDSFRKKISLNARARAESLTWERIAEQTVGVYEELSRK